MPRSLQARFITLLAVIGLAFATFVLVTATIQAKASRAAALKETLALARLVAARLDDHLLEMDTLVGAVGPAMSFQVSDQARNDEILKAVAKTLPPFVNNVAAWDLTGTNVGSLDPALRVKGFSVSDRQYFQRALQHPGLAIEAPVVSRSNGEFIAQFARAVTDKNGQVVGVVSASTRLLRLQDLVQPRGALPKGTLVSILDLNGTILARSIDPDLWIGKSVNNIPSFVENAGLLEGSRERMGVDGVARLSSFSSATRAPWRAFVGVPASAVFASTRAQFLESVELGLGLLLLSLVVVWFGTRSVSIALKQIARDATRFGDGDLKHRSQVSGITELAQLGSAMNAMASSLYARGAALEKSERRLRDITDAVPATISYMDRDQRFQFLNRAYTDWFGDSRPVIGQSLREFYGAAVYQTFAPQIEQVLKGHKETYERTAQTTSGTRHLQITVVPDFDFDGSVQGIYALASDVSEMKAAELERLQSEEKLQTITDNLPALVCYIDLDQIFRFNNKTYEKWLGRPVSDITDRPVAEVYGAEVYRRLEPSLLRGLAGELVRFDVEFKGRDDTTRIARGTYVPDRASDGTIRGVYGMISDVTNLRRAEEKLRRLAERDALTGLPNRGQFDQFLKELIGTAEGRSGQIALLFLDIDEFKLINDQYGHYVGDQVLVEFARRLTEMLRPSDMIARLGGDEFVVLLRRLLRPDDAVFVAEKIIRAMQTPFLIDGASYMVTVSIGIALAQPGESDVAEFLKRADAGLYAAKAAGRNNAKMVR